MTEYYSNSITLNGGVDLLCKLLTLACNTAYSTVNFSMHIKLESSLALLLTLFSLFHSRFSNKMSLELFFFITLFASVVHDDEAARLSCDESLLGKKGKFSRADLSDLISVDNQSQIKTCLIVLGKDQLEVEIAELLWNDLVKVRRANSRDIDGSISHGYLEILSVRYNFYRSIKRPMIFQRSCYSRWDG